MKSKSEFDAKRYVQLFMAGYVPRSKDEKKFVDKHVAQLHQDVNGNKDDVFNATNIPTHKRPPYHGYEKGQDERMYEDVEQIDEWSKGKLYDYITRATGDLRVKSFQDGMNKGDDKDTAERKLKKRDKRQRGISRAAQKLAFGKVSEDSEQIEEMNKSALSDKDLYHPKSIMRVKGYNKMNEPMQAAQIQWGTEIVSEHEGEGGHVAQVRYSNVRKDYQVHHYTNGYNLGEHPISFHDTKKDAVDTAKYTTTVRNHDYLDRHEVLAGRVGKGSAYGVEPKPTDEILRARGEIKEAIEALEEEMSDAQMAKRERIVKSMKKKAGTFKKRYGEKAEDVMYATATKMAMEDLDYVNLDMTDAVADLIESEHNLVGKQKNIDKNDNGKIDAEDLKLLRDQKGLKHMENQAKKVREVTKKYPMAQRDESVIEQLLSQIDEETVVLEFNSGETIEIVGTLAESILNIFMELSEDNQAQFEELISESMTDFEDALSFIAEAYEGNE